MKPPLTQVSKLPSSVHSNHRILGTDLERFLLGLQALGFEAPKSRVAGADVYVSSSLLGFWGKGFLPTFSDNGFSRLFCSGCCFKWRRASWLQASAKSLARRTPSTDPPCQKDQEPFALAVSGGVCRNDFGKFPQKFCNFSKCSLQCVAQRWGGVHCVQLSVR